MLAGFAFFVLGCVTSPAASYFGKGRAALDSGNNEQAVAYFSEVIRLNPNPNNAADLQNLSWTHNNRGVAYLRIGNFDQAITDFEVALRLNSNNENARNNLALAQRRQQEQRQQQLAQAQRPQQVAQAPATGQPRQVQAASPAALITTDTVIWNGNAATWIETVNGIRTGGNNRQHTITVSGNLSAIVTPATENTFGTVTGITVNINGNGAILPLGQGNLLRIGSGQTVVVRDITLQGSGNNNARLVVVGNGGTLRMEGSSAVSDNRGGGVSVAGGTLIMQDRAMVTGNEIADHRGDGGGVIVTRGTLTMRDSSSISGNRIIAFIGGNGGGVFFAGAGNLTMRDNASISDNRIICQRSGGGDGGGVFFNSSGNFTMQGSATVSGNATGNGDGVFFNSNGALVMEDSATVSNNRAERYHGLGMGYRPSRGGGVAFIGDGGVFTMRGNSTVSGNTSNEGGGVSLAGVGTFTMQDNSSVSGNTASSRGGGVIGRFTMRGNASISGNRGTTFGGGVYGTLVMHDSSTVSGNTARFNGGGVFGILTMHNNTAVTGNTANRDGGGVFGKLTMHSGTISGNTAGNHGGGVHIGGRRATTVAPAIPGDILAKTGGTIHGSNETDASLRNTATRGHAIYQESSVFWRNATAGPAMNPSIFGFWLSEPN